MHFPVSMTEKLKPYMDKDYNMNVVQEGETLRVILSRDKDSNKAKAVA